MEIEDFGIMKCEGPIGANLTDLEDDDQTTRLQREMFGVYLAALKPLSSGC